MFHCGMLINMSYWKDSIFMVILLGMRVLELDIVDNILLLSFGTT